MGFRQRRDRDGRNRLPNRQRVRAWSCSFSRALDIDRELQTVGPREPGLVFEVRGNPTVGDFAGLAESINLKKLGRESDAARVTLAALAIDAHPQRR
jgi:hypothetical protein